MHHRVHRVAVKSTAPSTWLDQSSAWMWGGLMMMMMMMIRRRRRLTECRRKLLRCQENRLIPTWFVLVPCCRSVTSRCHRRRNPSLTQIWTTRRRCLHEETFPVRTPGQCCCLSTEDTKKPNLDVGCTRGERSTDTLYCHILSHYHAPPKATTPVLWHSCPSLNLLFVLLFLLSAGF